MEDIEYLEEYEDFILPKTLNYSEEFPVTAMEDDLLYKTYNSLNTDLQTDVPEYEANISRCSLVSNPRPNKSNLVKIINTEVLRTPSQVLNYHKVVDDGARNQGIDDFSMHFDLDTATMSDISYDSLNFSTVNKHGIFPLDTLLTPKDFPDQKLKRKNIDVTGLGVNRKKYKYGNSSYSSKQIQKTGKPKESKTFSRNSSINRDQLETPHAANNKKSQSAHQKKNINSSGKKSKLVVKRNGKKFVFPDRSKFSLKKLNTSNNIVDETKATNNTLNISPEKHKNKDESCNSEATGNEINKVDIDQPKDVVIYSSPKNMKRIDSPAPIYQSPATPLKNILSFGHFSLKSIKPPSTPLKIKAPLPKLSPMSPHSGKEDKTSKPFLEPQTCLGTPEEDKEVIAALEKQICNVTCNKEKESHDHNEQVSNLHNKDEFLRMMQNALPYFDKYESSYLENTTKQISNIETENTNMKNLNDENSKASITNKELGDTVFSIDKTLKSFPKENDDEISTKDTFLEMQSNDFDENSLEKTESMISTNITENCNLKEVHEKNFIAQKSLEDFFKPNTTLKAKDNLLQKSSENVSDFTVSTNLNSIKQTIGKKDENENPKKTIGSDHETLESLEKLPKDKVSVKENLPNTPLNEKPIPPQLFEARGFDIRLNKNIVARLLKSGEAHTTPKVTKILDHTTKSTKPDIQIPENNVLSSTVPSTSPLKKSTQKLSKDPIESPGTKNKSKNRRMKRIVPSNASGNNNIKSLPPKPDDSTNNITSNVMTAPDAIDGEKRSVQPSMLKTYSKRSAPNEITSNVKESEIKKLPSILSNKPNVLVPPTSAESQTTDPESNSSSRKNTTQTMPKLKENNQLTPNGMEKNSPRKGYSTMSTSLPIADDISYETPAVQEKSGISFSDIEIITPKEEINDGTPAPVLELRPTNDPFHDNIKFNESPDLNIKQNSTGIKNVFKNSLDTLGKEQINPKYNIFELPAYIVMKTKIITRKDLGTNADLTPRVIKQQVEDIQSDLITPSAIKIERPVFNSVCALINSLLEQNANYLKFASNSERLTRMNHVLADYSLSVQDANCTLKFLESYLSSVATDKSIKTSGQQFIPIYDSQKKIIGYRKRTIYSKPSSSRRKMSKRNTQPVAPVTRMNPNPNLNAVASDAERPPKIEPNLLDGSESELIVPDTSPANVCIKNEDDLMTK